MKITSVMYMTTAVKKEAKFKSFGYVNFNASENRRSERCILRYESFRLLKEKDRGIGNRKNKCIQIRGARLILKNRGSPILWV